MNVDVLVIGAGIQGAGVAQAVAAAGYSVLVVEKNEPAWGTSSRSSKLIHGGLRYLESGQFKLVYECLHERAILLKNAPSLVSLKPFYIPIYKETSRSPLTIHLGLLLYKILSGFDGSGAYRKVPKSEWSMLDGIRTDGLKAVYQYFDGQTDDALLTRAVLKSAESLGARVMYPVSFSTAAHLEEGWCATLNSTKGKQDVRCKVIVNAAGPWVNNVLRLVNAGLIKHEVDLVQGTHIIVPEKPMDGIFYLEAPSDQRAVFIMPWGGKTMIGTTEKAFYGEPDTVVPSFEEIDYLLKTAASYFPKFQSYSAEDITESFAGLRVLPGGGSNAFNKARDTVVHEDLVNAPGLITLYGGKLTAYRATAEQVMTKVQKHLPAKMPVAQTRDIALS